MAVRCCASSTRSSGRTVSNGRLVFTMDVVRHQDDTVMTMDVRAPSSKPGACGRAVEPDAALPPAHLGPAAKRRAAGASSPMPSAASGRRGSPMRGGIYLPSVATLQRRRLFVTVAVDSKPSSTAGTSSTAAISMSPVREARQPVPVPRCRVDQVAPAMATPLAGEDGRLDQRDRAEYRRNRR